MKQIPYTLNRFKKIIAITALFLCALPLFPRDVTVVVKDSELDIPLEGAVIRTRDGREQICDENGTAVIQAPDDRQIIIYAAYPGYETGVLTIPVTGNSFTFALRLSGIMESRELVLEASRPGTSESRTGRSVAVGSKEIAQTAEIGIIEDVMSTIKLLPGVNYSGFFNAQPSIRGGHPGDMSASLDGFYINNPYHWGGGFSIFDPRMVQSAQLSHGVFSTRYGHTISGLLEITSKDPSPTETQLELGINTSAANFNLSLPLAGRGGLLFMGRVTYYDPVIALAKEFSKTVPELEIVNSVLTAPYIRSGTITGNYRFTDNLELSATGFWGMDGVGVYYLNSSRSKALDSDTSLDFDFTNYQGFFTTALFWNPRRDMLLKFSVGTGYEDQIIDGDITYNIYKKEFSDEFKDKYPDTDASYEYNENNLIKQSDLLFNVQGRIDYDWELTENFLLAAGVQEMYNRYSSSGRQKAFNEILFSRLESYEKIILMSHFDLPPDFPWDSVIVGRSVFYSPDSQNDLFTTSGYILGEYSSSDNRFKAELGLRIDHFYLTGKGFSLSSEPAFNPRLNLDFNLFKGSGFLQSLDLSAGTGLFSSVNDDVFIAEEQYNISSLKPNRSWTSVLGIKFEFPESLSLNIEGYYKYIFDRTYILVLGFDEPDIKPFFDGEGIVWGIDAMLQKIQSRFWDGWLSYSFNWAKYRDPNGRFGVMGRSGGNRGDDWYFPSYHRFHNLNLIVNIKPVPNINLYARFGLASGVPLSQRIGDGPTGYPLLVFNNDDPSKSYFIEKYYWNAVLDESNRTTLSLPFDLKFSIYGNNKNGKTRYELYIAVENVLALLYAAQGNTSFNQYTGEIDTGSNSASYEIPIPIPSFGFKISY
jgi:hypothetical protein